MTIITSVKSKFAKFVDGTIGAILIFIASAAIFAYYTPVPMLSIFSGITVTVCAILLLRLKNKRDCAKQKLSQNAADMFFDFMFLDEYAPAKLLCAGLNGKAQRAVRRGKGVYLNRTAAFCFFGCPPNEATAARTMARAKHYGANTTLFLTERQSHVPTDIAGITAKNIYGDDVYKLFASLCALPEKKFARRKKSRRAALSGALSKDKILRYVLLSAFMFALSVFLHRSVIMLACAVICAALAIAATTLNAVKYAKEKRLARRESP